MKKYKLGIYEKAMPRDMSWKEKLSVAKRAGYDFVEMSIDETDEKLARLDWSEKERAALLNDMRETGLMVRSICLSAHRKYSLGSSDPDNCARGLEILKKAVKLAEDLGIRIIMLAGYDVYYEQSSSETVRRFAENLKKAVEMAAAAGVILGFETMETEFMNTVKKAMNYVNEMSSPYLQIYPDSGNLTNTALTYGSDVWNDLKCGEGHLLAMHLKETIPGCFREIPFGTGHVNFETMIKTAWELGVRRFVVECWCTDEFWENEIRTAKLMMVSIFKELE